MSEFKIERDCRRFRCVVECLVSDDIEVLTEWSLVPLFFESYAEVGPLLEIRGCQDLTVGGCGELGCNLL